MVDEERSGEPATTTEPVDVNGKAEKEQGLILSLQEAPTVSPKTSAEVPSNLLDISMAREPRLILGPKEAPTLSPKTAETVPSKMAGISMTKKPKSKFDSGKSEAGQSIISTCAPPTTRPSAMSVYMQRAGGDKKRTVKRIVDRDAPAHQSWGKLSVRHTKKNSKLIWTDIYHVIIHMPLWQLLIMFVAGYAACLLVFAGFWLAIPEEECSADIYTFTDAFYLSVETQMTVGYGVPDPNFNGCPDAAIVLFAQVLSGLILDALMIGMVFQRLTCATTRAYTVIFSKCACLQEINGVVHLVFRVAEMQSHPLLQAVMQVYCVQHHDPNKQQPGIRSGGIFVEVSSMRLIQPDADTNSGVLFLGLPTMVVHRIDYQSPLAPPKPDEDDIGVSSSPIRHEDCPTYDQVRAHLETLPFLEVLVLLSGTEDSTASSTEARHSYTLDEMYWDRTFARCVTVDSDGHHAVDFTMIHETVDPPVDEHGDFKRSVSSQINEPCSATMQQANRATWACF